MSCFVYRNGVSGAGQLNYNRLLGEMQFIDPKGDTMALADEQNVAHVTIGQRGLDVYATRRDQPGALKVETGKYEAAVKKLDSIQ